MKVHSDTKPNKFTFEKYPCGGYILWLRENFHEVSENEQDSLNGWIYDEYTVLIPEYLSDSFIEKNFEKYLTEARIKEASKSLDRLSVIEDAIQDIFDILASITG